MSYNRFSGDPAVKITPDGAVIKFIGGQPVMDSGLANTVQISLFTKRGWWGNVLFKEDSKKIGSDFEARCMEPIIALSSVNKITDAGEKALAWMKDSGTIQKADVNVTNPRNDFIKTEIVITPPGQDDLEFLFTKNGLSWKNQAQNPAYEMMEDV